MSNVDALCDVLVAGGGVAGVCAALAAARQNVPVILTEKEGFLGGVGYSGLFQNICGLYVNGDEFPEDTLNAGLARELVSRLHHLSPQKRARKAGQVYVLPYRREELNALFHSLCAETPGLAVLYNTSVVSVETDPGGPTAKNRTGKSSQVKKEKVVTAVKVRGPEGVKNIIPGVLIDCSGDGSVSEMAGADFALSPPENIQMAGYIIRLKGLRDVDESLSIKVPYYLTGAVNRHALPPYLRFTMFTAGDAPDEGYCKISFNSDLRKDREQQARDDALALLRCLAAKLPAFKNASIAETSLHVMDREGRRIRGEYTLTEEDVLRAGKFEDGVVKNAWPVELWDQKKGTIYKYLEPGEYYEIPFRCLNVKGLANLLCAGRCISVTPGALGSTRVMGTCMSLGEQAGLAAAHYAKNGSYPF